MAEPDNGVAPQEDPKLEISITLNQRTGELYVTGCVNVLPYALGMLEAGLLLVKSQWAKAQDAARPRVMLPSPNRPGIVL